MVFTHFVCHYHSPPYVIMCVSPLPSSIGGRWCSPALCVTVTLHNMSLCVCHLCLLPSGVGGVHPLCVCITISLCVCDLCLLPSGVGDVFSLCVQQPAQILFVRAVPMNRQTVNSRETHLFGLLCKSVWVSSMLSLDIACPFFTI